MSAAYSPYLKQHRENVWKGFLWIRENLPILIYDSQEFGGTINYEWQIQTSHDYSKDDPGEGETILEMPHNFIIEMICDWWAFSWEKGNPYEIFDWYAAHKDYIKLHPKSRDYVDYALEQIKSTLDARGGK